MPYTHEPEIAALRKWVVTRSRQPGQCGEGLKRKPFYYVKEKREWRVREESEGQIYAPSLWT